MSLISPGIQITERDLTDVAPTVGTSVGAHAGIFKWGPVEEIVQIGNERELVAIFGKPDDYTYKSFFTAANFLSYGGVLQLVRVVGATAENATSSVSTVRGTETSDDVSSSSSSTSSNSSSSNTNSSSSSSSSTSDNVLVKNREHYDSLSLTAALVAKYPGRLGNSLHVSIVDDNEVFEDSWTSTINGTVYDNAAEFDTGGPGTSTFVSDRGGSNDEMHIIIRDKDGSWTGTIGTVLEKFAYVSKASDAVRSDGSSNYYRNVLNNESAYVWHGAHVSGGTNWGNTAAGTTFTQVGQVDITFTKGHEGNESVTNAEYVAGFDLFEDPETVEIDLLIAGSADQTTARAIVDIADTRKDCVAFVSPEYSDVQVGLTNTTKLANVLDFEKNILNRNTSYAVLDSGWKYQYDIYNDTYRYVPLNADTAGLCARTDSTNDPWFSPAGFNRGQIKNVIKLAFNPTKDQRDSLYKQGINPVVSLAGEGTLLYGDKTLLNKPSAFDRINVRRLFLILEKTIARAAKGQLFEFNDDFTRTQFLAIVEPFLRDVQGRRGITDFQVICDESNNTQQVIDNAEFVADIYVKPSRSINFIRLNFVAVRSNISFSEIG